MSDLSDRMRQQLATRDRSDPAQPFVAPPRIYERRITLDLTAEDHQALKLAAVEQRTTMADLLRGLVALWRDDPALAQRIEELPKSH